MIAVRWPCDNPIYWAVQPEVATTATSSAEHEPSIFERHEQGGPLDGNAHVHGAVIMGILLGMPCIAPSSQPGALTMEGMLMNGRINHKISLTYYQCCRYQSNGAGRGIGGEKGEKSEAADSITIHLTTNPTSARVCSARGIPCSSCHRLPRRSGTFYPCSSGLGPPR